MRGRGQGWPPGPRFWDSHLFPNNPRQTVHFLDTFPPAVCVCVVRGLEVGLLQKPGALLREIHAAEEGVEAGLASLPAPLNFQRRELFLRLLLQDKEPAEQITA